MAEPDTHQVVISEQRSGSDRRSATDRRSVKRPTSSKRPARAEIGAFLRKHLLPDVEDVSNEVEA